MTPLNAAFNQFVKDQGLFPKTDTLIVAVSGGQDSVVLAHLLYKMGQPLVLAHANFQLRGSESERDEQFVRDFASRHALPLEIQRFDCKAYASGHHLSIQEAARVLRYQWFETLAFRHRKPPNTTWIATAHHAQDSVETMLHHLFRGTGIDGIHGILTKQGNIVRPLLFAGKKAIHEYAVANDISWVDDSSNESTRYTRNYIRHKVLPVIEAHYPAALSNMQGTIEKLAEAGMLYHQAVSHTISKLTEKDEKETKVAVNKLKKQVPLRTIVYELFKPYGFSEGQVGELVKLLHASNASYIVSPSHRVIRNRAWLIISPLVPEGEQSQVVVEHGDAKVLFGQQRLAIKCLAAPAEEVWKKTGPMEVYADASHIEWPLLLRPWRAGDYFYPLGMPKKKKLARFFIDIKLSKTEKEKIWVLESNKKVVWVVGQRLDDRFKITSQTKEVLHLMIQ